MNGQGKLLTHFLKNADKLIIPVYQRKFFADGYEDGWVMGIQR